MITGNELLERFLKSSIEKPADEAHVQELIPVFSGILHFYKCLHGHPTPYHDITVFIYNYNKEIRIDDLDILMGAIELKLADISDDQVNCFRKFRRHITLAVTQKYYIQKVADNAFNTANEAKSVAQEAGEQANKAKLTYEGMMVNYITILGIFASIIITIFGGMQIISATTGLLQADLNIATLILVLSFLTFLIILILWMLFTFISNRLCCIKIS